MMARIHLFPAVTGVSLGLIVLGACGSAAKADFLSGLSDMTAADGQMLTLSYGGTTYTPNDLMLGTTTRWWINGEGTSVLWDPNDPLTTPPLSPPPVPGTSDPKPGDIGAHADNFSLTVDGVTDISSLDGINFQETLFPNLSDTFFIFERGGNDAGSMQGIMEGGFLRDEVTFATAGNGGPYANTGVSVSGQNAFGVVFKTDVPVQGLRITASGHDALIIAAVIPEPSTLSLLALGGLAFLYSARRKR
jgi:hypothetical protein